MNLGWATAYFAGGMAIWQALSSWFQRLSGLFLVRTTVEGYAKEAVLRWCWKNLKRSPLGVRRYVVYEEYVRPMKRRGLAPFEVPSQALTFFRGWFPLFVGGNANTAGSDMPRGDSFTLTYIRGTFNIEEILVSAVKELDQQRHGAFSEALTRFCVWRVMGSNQAPGGGDKAELSSAQPRGGIPNSSAGDAVPLLWTREELGEPREAAPFSRLAYEADTDKFIEEVRRWKNSKDWFNARGIPWRMGAGLFGPPGTGKSSLARAVAQELDLPIHSYDLSSMDNRDLVRAWENSLANSPCVVLLEDIDRLFDKDKNLKQTEGRPGITLDCLLNCISGAGNADGILVIATANDPSRLDDALGVPTTAGGSTRPGRLDRVLFIGPLSEDGRRKVATRILADYPDLVEREVGAGVGETGAQFEKRCTDLALARYWTEGAPAANLVTLPAHTPSDAAPAPLERRRTAY